jgi:hypothetical protein
MALVKETRGFFRQIVVSHGSNVAPATRYTAWRAYADGDGCGDSDGRSFSHGPARAQTGQ